MFFFPLIFRAELERQRRLHAMEVQSVEEARSVQILALLTLRSLILNFVRLDTEKHNQTNYNISPKLVKTDYASRV